MPVAQLRVLMQHWPGVGSRAAPLVAPLAAGAEVQHGESGNRAAQRRLKQHDWRDSECLWHGPGPQASDFSIENSANSGEIPPKVRQNLGKTTVLVTFSTNQLRYSRERAL